MYDTFSSFETLEFIAFKFQYNRYEVWQNSKMIDSGDNSSILDFQPVMEEGNERIQIISNNHNLTKHIRNRFILDTFFTHRDRLMMFTLPAETDKDYTVFILFSATLPPTRIYKVFGSDEPYCCSLFLTNMIPVKITFSFNNPEKLIEFYL